MAQFYVPMSLNAKQTRNLAFGLMPHTAPLEAQPHFESHDDAVDYLSSHAAQSPYYGDTKQGESKEGMPAITYGPKHDALSWPAVELIYAVDIQSEEKLREIRAHDGETTLDPSSVKSINVHFSHDALHKEWDPPEIKPKLGEQIQMQHITDQLLQRGTDLQRLYHILERSGPKEREELDMDNPEHADIMRKLCVYDEKKKVAGSLEDRTMQMVLRQLGAEIGGRSAIELSKSQIEAEFNARLEALPPETPAAERVAVAMEGTLQKFAAQVPARDAGTFTKVASQVKGTINDLAQEVKGDRISEFEMGALPDELRPAWAKVPEDDKDEFVEEFYRQRAERAELDAAADRAVFAATTFAMTHAAQQVGDMLKLDAYGDVQAELETLELAEHEEIMGD
ncbi:MAG: hypothetical protein IJZ68_06430 [Bacteroidaceae bacterium]|nr:hypothetical protein [Bacteroidaceae bacterium]